jgi:hypothetical protein
MKSMAPTATILILLRQTIATLHGLGHLQAGVGLAPWQQAFVAVVITAAPLLALVLYWTPFQRAAALLLGTSMLAGMLFGIYYHFIAATNDHVSQVPEGHGHMLFVATAVALVPIELAATAYGFWTWRQLSRAGR